MNRIKYFCSFVTVVRRSERAERILVMKKQQRSPSTKSQNSTASSRAQPQGGAPKQPVVAPSRSPQRPSTSENVQNIGRRPAGSGHPSSSKPQASSASSLWMSSSPAAQELLAVIQYLDVVQTSLLHRAKSLPVPPIKPEAAVVSPGGRPISGQPGAPTVLSLGGIVGAPRNHGGSQPPIISTGVILDRIYKSAIDLLQWHLTLETRLLPPHTTIDEIEHSIHHRSSELATAIDECCRKCEDIVQRASESQGEGVDAQQADSIRNGIAAMWSSQRSVIDDCHLTIQRLLASAKQVSLIRRVVLERDVNRAKLVMAELKKVSGGSGSAAMQSSTSAFLLWVEKQWIPAMQDWQKIVENAQKVAAPGSSEAIEKALIVSQSEVANRSASIREILRPGETVQELFENNVEREIRKFGAQVSKQKTTIAQLKAAVEKIDFVSLASCIRAMDEFTTTLSKDERNLISEAQQLLMDVQQVAKVTVGLSLALRSPEILGVTRAVHSANEVMYNLKLFGNEKGILDALKLGGLLLGLPSSVASSPPKKVVGTSEPNGGVPPVQTATQLELLKKMPANFCASKQLYVDHVPSRAWAPELSVLYQKGCSVIDELLVKDHLLAALQDQVMLIQSTHQSQEGSSVSDFLPTARILPPDELRSLVDRCREHGVKTDLIATVENILNRSQQLRIKVHFDSRIRVVLVDPNVAFGEVSTKVHQACGLSPPVSVVSMQGVATTGGVFSSGLRIRYQDQEGDFITIVDASDWDTVVAELKSCSIGGGNSAGDHGSNGGGGLGGLKLEIFCDVPLLPAAQQNFQSPKLQQPRAEGMFAFASPPHKAPRGTTPQQAARLVTPTRAPDEDRAGRLGQVEGQPLHLQGVSAMKPLQPPARQVPPQHLQPLQPSSAFSVQNVSNNAKHALASAALAQSPSAERDSTASAFTFRTVHIQPTEVSKWENATQEALELLTIASQDTAPSREPSKSAGSAHLPESRRSAEGPVPIPGRWDDRSAIDIAEIQTIASEETANVPHGSSDDSHFQRQHVVGRPGSGSSPQPAKTRVQMMTQLRQQKQALEAQSKVLRGVAQQQQVQLQLGKK